MRRSAALLLLSACVSGFDLDSQRYHCAQDSDCGAGWKCVSGVCASGSSADGGTTAAVRASASCPSVTACGGSLGGRWTYTDVCLDPVQPFLNVPVECGELTFSNVRGVVTDGSLVFSGGRMTRSHLVRVQADLKVGSFCSHSNCNFTKTEYLKGFPTATCTAATDSSGDCTCPLTFEESLSEDGAFATASGTVTATTDGGVSTFDYCVSGGQLVLKQTGGPRVLNAVVTLAR